MLDIWEDAVASFDFHLPVICLGCHPGDISVCTSLEYPFPLNFSPFQLFAFHLVTALALSGIPGAHIVQAQQLLHRFANLNKDRSILITADGDLSERKTLQLEIPTCRLGRILASSPGYSLKVESDKVSYCWGVGCC